MVTRFELSTTDLEPRARAVANRFHASRPDSRYTGKCGVAFDSTTVNTRLNTARYRIGFNIDQAAPRTEDLYLTLTSLRTRFARISRSPAISRKRERGWSRGGSEVRTETVEVVARADPFMPTSTDGGGQASLARAILRTAEATISQHPRAESYSGPPAGPSARRRSRSATRALSSFSSRPGV